MWHLDLVKVMRIFLEIVAIVFVLAGAAMLILTLPLHFPWTVHRDLAARYAVLFLGIAVFLAAALKKTQGKRSR